MDAYKIDLIIEPKENYNKDILINSAVNELTRMGYKVLKVDYKEKSYDKSESAKKFFNIPSYLLDVATIFILVESNFNFRIALGCMPETITDYYEIFGINPELINIIE